MTCPFVVDDGAYVLGALAPAERAEFERHLSICPTCRDAVANLAVLPGLLGRLDAATAAGTAATLRTSAGDQRAAGAMPPDLLDGLLAAATRERAAERRAARAGRLRLVAAACLAAIVLAAGVGIGVNMLEDRGPAVAQTPMTPTAATVPVTAEIGVTALDGGSRITMTCRYPIMDGGPWMLRLVVFPHGGPDGDQVGTWTAAAGDEYSITATTHLAPDEIGRIELQRADRNPLLTWSPP